MITSDLPLYFMVQWLCPGCLARFWLCLRATSELVRGAKTSRGGDGMIGLFIVGRLMGKGVGGGSYPELCQHSRREGGRAACANPETIDISPCICFTGVDARRRLPRRPPRRRPSYLQVQTQLPEALPNPSNFHSVHPQGRAHDLRHTALAPVEASWVRTSGECQPLSGGRFRPLSMDRVRNWFAHLHTF
jgi:hypothetical protein